MDVQVVAFPQLGVIRAPGTADLLRDALVAGAEVIGGLDPISIDRDPKGQLDLIFALAEEFDVEVDIHLHDRGEVGAITLEMIAERTAARPSSASAAAPPFLAWEAVRWHRRPALSAVFSLKGAAVIGGVGYLYIAQREVRSVSEWVSRSVSTTQYCE